MNAVHPRLPLPVSVSLPDLPAPTSAAALKLARLQAFVLRCPIATPVRTSFGTMVDRPAVFVRAEDTDGAVGWGEIWCNFPSCGAEHRARLLDTVLAPLLLGQAFSGPVQAYEHATARTRILALQTGEHGPLAQVIAGIDLALWDLWSRRAGLPLHRLLGGTRSTVPVYASGINPDAPEQVVARQRAGGYRAFKLKVGFGVERDLDNVRAIRAVLQPGDAFMLDANQAWSVAEAGAMLQRLQPLGIGWLEEPLAADTPLADWQALRAGSAIPLAAGENLQGEANFAAAIASRAFDVIQPDLAKWGGISGTWPVIQRIRDAGLRYCPHYLGAGIGLLASAQVLAAAGGDGLLEVDANPNALRSGLAPMLDHVVDGRVSLGEGPGLGVDVDLARARALCG
jgi:D-galactarolactone cycloisomerase